MPKARHKVKRICETCNKEFERYPSQAKRFCSKNCMFIGQKGSGHPNYIGTVACVCGYCGKHLEKHARYIEKYKTTYCNARCHDKAQIGVEIAPRLELKCQQCGNVFRVKKSGLANHHMFCTPRCRYDSQKVAKIERTCEHCHNIFLAFPSAIKYHGARFCSNTCKDTYNRGWNNVRFKDASSEVEKLRQSPAYIAWRTSVFIRDGKKCIWCGSTKDIEADHIKPRYLFPELTLELSNGRTLCNSCHRKTPSYMNRYMKRSDFE